MKIGFVVNPTAGAGGRIGLKGSDNFEEVERKGGVAISPLIASKFCRKLDGEAEILTCSSSMGADYIDGKIVYRTEGRTTAKDTVKACRAFLKKGAKIIVFVGGDGTARDIYAVTAKKIPILGVPAGVKMYSSVFAINVERAKAILHEFVNGRAEMVEREIMDVDENAFRRDELKIRIYGIAIVPSIRYFLQGGKRLFFGDEHARKEMAEFIALACREKRCILGPGNTVKAIADEMGVKKTLLGVDVVENGRMLAKDADEKTLLEFVNKQVKIIVSPIGGSNFIFGRGNQQISADVIRKVGLKNIIIVATPSKMMNAPFLYADTGDEEINKNLAGWRQVVVGYGIAVRKKIVI